MHISSLITGLLGLPSLTSGLAIVNTTTGVVITNTTKVVNDTSSKIGWPRLPPGLHGGHGPVVFPPEKWEQIPVDNSSSRPETNTTTGVTISNTTKGVNDTSSKINWPQLPPVIGDGPGPVVIPEDQWEQIHANDSHSWLVAFPIEEHESLRRGRRVSTEERRAALINKRDGPGDPLPPRDRTLADHMENHGSMLPDCYKRCMRSQDGKASMHMGKDNLGKICGIKWPMFAWWSEHDLYDCVNGGGGCANKEDHRVAYRWLKWTCGDKPSRV